AGDRARLQRRFHRPRPGSRARVRRRGRRDPSRRREPVRSPARARRELRARRRAASRAAPARSSLSAAFLSATELARAYGRRELSPAEVPRGRLARIEPLDPELRSLIPVPPERAMEQARAAEATLVRGTAGPLCGVPVGIKDLFDVAGVRCTAGSRVLADHVPDRDA